MNFLNSLKDKITDFAQNRKPNETIIIPLNDSVTKKPNPLDLLSKEEKELYYEFDDSHYDAAYRWFDKYYDETANIEDDFYSIFDYKKRISALKKAIKAYDRFFGNFSKYGRGGELFFQIEFPEVNKEYEPTDFCKEYPISFENVNCTKWLLQYYTEHQEEVSQIIQDEYIEHEYGSYEEYEEEMQYQKHIKELKAKVTTLIKKNDGILQKDLFKQFDPDDVNFIRNYIKNLADETKVTRVKSGNTYALHFNKPVKK